MSTAVISVKVDEDLKRKAKAKAALEGRTLKEVIEELLGVYLLKTPSENVDEEEELDAQEHA